MNAPSGECVAVDVGNTRVKIGWYARGEVRRAAPWDQVRLEDWADLVGLPLVLSSVRAEASAQAAIHALEAHCQSGRTLVLGADISLAIPHRYRTPQTLGTDRILAAAAAQRRHGAALVLDAGTAWTLDGIDSEGTYLGGAIAPGFGPLADGLRLRAPHLPVQPLVDRPVVAPWPGQSTDDCLRLGQRAAAEGSLRALLAMARAALGPAIPCVLTGGDAAAVADLWPADEPPAILEPDLLLAGIGDVWQASKH